MREQILKLRAQGCSYKQICETLGCAKSTVSYYCGTDQKAKTAQRNRIRRQAHVIAGRADRFQDRKLSNCPRKPVKATAKKRLRSKADDFQRRVGGKLKVRDIRFKYQDVIAKFGNRTSCYLTGRAIELNEPRTYQFDHIVPATRGGDNSLDNLGIACCAANAAKHNLTVAELLELCTEILTHHGYSVIRAV